MVSYMPLYNYRCPECNHVSSHQVPFDDLETIQRCEFCGSESAEYEFAAPMIGTERLRNGRQIIWDERQVTQEKGPRWRDEGTTGKEGGRGKKQHYT